MSDKLTAQIIRGLIVAIMLIPLSSIQGLDLRSAQHSFFFLGVILTFAFLLRNVWLTAFLAWTVCSFSYYKFQTGGLYVYNILIGSMLYYMTKISFKKENVNLVINAFLWLVFGNVVVMVLQSVGLDWMFNVLLRAKDGTTSIIDIVDQAGIMGFKACMGVVVALAMPLLLSRWNLVSKIGSGLLIIPLYISRASICIVGAIVGVMFVLWYKDIGIRKYRISSKTVWGILLAGLIVLGTAYVILVDAPMGTLPTRIYQWKVSLHDCLVHPVMGWGLDSFRNELNWKPFVYAMNPSVSANGMNADHWDNAHNLYVQTFFEWGIVGLLILVGYTRGLFLRFNRCIKDSNTVGLFGFFVTLLIVNMAQFPMFLSRTVCFIIPVMAVLEITMGGDSERSD